MDVKAIISAMTLEEKASLMSGKNFWETKNIDQYQIPSIFCADGPHGIRKQMKSSDHLGLNESFKSTCFPPSATIANSWNVELAEIMGIALGREAVFQNVNVVLGPGINIKRNPLCGRNFEYYSEDPYLAGKLAAAAVRGIQSNGVAACLKHFAANNQEERRMTNNSVMDERTLREIYLTAFEIAVKEGKAKTIMSSYNLVNGEYANEDKHLLKEILRDEWGFDGVVITDWGGNNDRVKALEAGNELEMPTTNGETNDEIVEAVTSGKLDEKILNEAVERLLNLVYETDAALSKEKTKPDFDVQHRVALNAAEECIVLLKNTDRLLPIKTGARVAIIGDFAATPRYQGSGSSLINPTRVDSALSNIGLYDVNYMGFEPGYKRHGGKSKTLLQRAQKLAEKSDIAVLFLGLDEFGETEGLDRSQMKLPENQRILLKTLKADGVKIVAVLSCGAPIEMDWTDDCDAVLHTYLGGQAGAKAVLNILTGKANPSGKLAESYPMQYEDCPSSSYFHANNFSAEYRESVYVGYRYYDKTRRKIKYPFGFGLSYTTFEYSDLCVDESGATFKIKNTGSVAGAEIAQLYIAAENSKIFRPAKELKGFHKVYLLPGESEEIKITFDEYSFRFFNAASNRWETEPCEYKIMIGASCADIKLSDTLSVDGNMGQTPYSAKDLPSYYSGEIKNVSRSEFGKLCGREIPEPQYHFLKKNRIEITSNTDIADLKYARGWTGRLFAGSLVFAYNTLRALGKRKAANVILMGMYHMPLRGISRMTGGAISWGQLNGLIIMFNGKFFKGVRLFFKEGRIRKRKKRSQKANTEK